MAVVMNTVSHIENMASLVLGIKYHRLRNTYCFEVEVRICLFIYILKFIYVLKFVKICVPSV